MSTSCANELVFFFFNDTATTEIYTLSYTTLFRSRHDPARGIPRLARRQRCVGEPALARRGRGGGQPRARDRKSTRLNSSHLVISYAVFCLKKKHPRLRWQSPLGWCWYSISTQRRF